MDKDITITKKTVKRARSWFARALDATGWLIILGMIGVGLATATVAGMIWLLFSAETVLAFGMLVGAIFTIVGSVALLHRLDRSVKRLRA